MSDSANPEDKHSSDKTDLLDDQGAEQVAGETLEQVGATSVAPHVEARTEKSQPSTGRSAFFVGAGILLSRIVGLVRQRIFAHYFLD